MTTPAWSFSDFPVDRLSWQLARASLSGGPALSGPGQVGAVDGGGWWVCQAGPTLVGDDASAKAWRALLLSADGGINAFEVPYIEEAKVAHAATLHADAANRATTFSLSIDVAVIAGEAFSIVHASGMVRLYMAVSVGALSAGVQSVTFRPPLREATAGATAVDFADPRCYMRLVDPKGEAWGEFESNFVATPSVSFVEDFAAPGS